MLFEGSFCVARVADAARWAPREACTGEVALLVAGLPDALSVGANASADGLADVAARLGHPAAEWLTIAIQPSDGPPLGVVHVMGPAKVPAADASLVAGLSLTASSAVQTAHRLQTQREATQVADDALGIVAHDLRGPLNNITMSASLLDAHLQRRDGQTDKERTFLQRIGAGAHRMNLMIEDLVVVSPGDAAARRGDLRPTDAPSLVTAALQRVAPMAEAKNCRIDRPFTVGDALEILADRETMLHAIVNVLGNAVRVTPTGGVVSMGLVREGRFAVFSVQDEGPPIATADLPRAFDRFGKSLDGTRDGGGLSMFVARSLVVAQGGAIAADCVDGRVTIRISAPVA